MNEATFEARIQKEIKRFFPTISQDEITHQKTFTIKLGHQNIQINGKSKSQARGRLDVLLSHKNKHLAVLELKHPDHPIIDTDDIDQGLSYARLLDPMPPLVLISNGNDTKILQTYDKKELSSNNFNHKAIKSLFNHSLSLAASAKDESIKILLGQQKELWLKIFNKRQDDEFSRLTGNIGDFSYPLVKDFSLNREISHKVLESLSDSKKILAIVGGPLSGKTNIAHQICIHSKKKNYIPYFIDYASESFGILTSITNTLAEEVFFHMTSQEVKSWLLYAHTKDQDEKILFVIDGISPENISSLKKDLEQIHSISEKSGFKIIFLCDPNSYKQLTIISGRQQKTKLGRNTDKQTLKNLNLKEYSDALEVLYKKYNFSFQKGGEGNLDYRKPRLLRLLTWSQSKIARRPGYYAKLPAVTTPNMIHQSWEQFSPDEEFISDYQLLAKAFVKEQANTKLDKIVAFQCYGIGSVNLIYAEKELGITRVERLCSTGLAKKILGVDERVLLQPTLPELISVAAINHIMDNVCSELDHENYDSGYQILLKESEKLPYGELAGTILIHKILERFPLAFQKFITKLVKDKPVKSSISKNAMMAFHLPEHGIFEFKMDDLGLEDNTALSNAYPWLLLSCLLQNPFTTNDEDFSYYINILVTVASFPNILKKPYITEFEEMKEYHVHSINDVDILCPKSGLIEYITYSISVFMLECPKDFVNLVKYVLNDNVNIALINRIYMALYFHQEIDDKDTKDIIKKYLPLVKQRINETIP